MTNSRHSGGEVVCSALSRIGVRVLFSVSGNQVLPIYDAAPGAGLRIIHTRHETAAAYAAAAHAELREDVGCVLTSAGPGFLAALQGVAATRTMELPVLFLSGDSPVTQRGRGAFQELDQVGIVGTICKGSFRVDTVDEIPRVLEEAARLARQGIPGPVHVGLPGDILASSGVTGERQSPVEEPDQLTDAQVGAIDAAATRLRSARRPLVLLRPSAARGSTGRRVREITAKLGIEPVVIEAPRGLADLKYATIGPRFPESDCALVIAPADFALGFLAPSRLARDGDILLVDAPDDPPSDRSVAIHIQAAPSLVVERLARQLGEADGVDPDWAGLWPVARPPDSETVPAGEVHPLAVSEALRQMIEPDDVIVLDGGEFCQWIRLGLRDLPNRLLWNGKIGAIGGGIPMAVGAAIAAGGKRVIAIMGDGSAGYHLSEFETMARYGLNVVALIGNDARWAAEWHLQVARYGPDRTFETELLPARYDRVAAGFDAHSEVVTSAGELPHALHEAFGRTGASCINVRVAALPSPAAMS